MVDGAGRLFPAYSHSVRVPTNAFSPSPIFDLHFWFKLHGSFDRWKFNSALCPEQFNLTNIESPLVRDGSLWRMV
jgi:hypothetical protein